MDLFSWAECEMNLCVIWKYTVLWILSIRRYYSELLKREVVHGWVWFDYVLVYSRRLTHLLLCPSHLIFWVNCGGVKKGGHLAATCAASSILNRNGKCSKKNLHRSSFVRLRLPSASLDRFSGCQVIKHTFQCGRPLNLPHYLGLNKCRLFHKPRQILSCVILQGILTLYAWRIPPQDYLALPEIHPF